MCKQLSFTQMLRDAVVKYNQSVCIKISYNSNAELSEESLDVLVPSYPGSPRSFNLGSVLSLGSPETTSHAHLTEAVEFLHTEYDLLVAAELGNEELLEILIRKGVNIQQIDHLGRNALHLAVCSGSDTAVMMLIDAGVNPNVKDSVGMTPLILCLMRNPSVKIAKLLFKHGAKIMPRSQTMDTGIFIQFVMMCRPTEEEEKIIRLLVEKGCLINDPEAPGGRQGLHFAAMSNNCKLIRILVDLGADLTLKNHRHQTPKEVALAFNCREAYNLLEQLERIAEEENTT